MKKALIFLLLTMPVFGEEYKGVSIPKGIKMTYDRLEDEAVFKNRKIPHALWVVVIHTKDKEIVLASSVADWGALYSSLDKAIVYIENRDEIKSYTLEKWDNATYSYEVASSHKLERLHPKYKDFLNFLEVNIRLDSKITVRFFGEYTSDKKLKKKDIERITQIIELKKTLQSVLKK